MSVCSTVCLMAPLSCGPCTPTESPSCVHLHSDVSFEAPSLSNMHLEKYEHTRTRAEKNTQYPTPGASSNLRICSCLFQDIKKYFFFLTSFSISISQVRHELEFSMCEYQTWFCALPQGTGQWVIHNIALQFEFLVLLILLHRYFQS